MIAGLMQHDHPLTIRHVLDRMRSMNSGAEVVTLRDPSGSSSRARFGEVAQRVDRLCSALAALGVRPGDRVGTLCWNTQEHFEAYLGVPSMGAVLHTLNNRLSPEQLRYVIEHAEDRVLLVDGCLLPVLNEVAPKLRTVEHVLVFGEREGDARGPGEVHSYEELLAGRPGGYDYPRIEDKSAAALCYTSGTTGSPKGVLYSHRSNMLFAMSLLAADAMGISRYDRVMPVVPMFHANAWGMPIAAGLAGADLVLPSRHLGPEPLASLIETERVTITAGVPTVFMDLLRHADERRPDLSSLRAVPCGGSAVPLGLAEGFARHGVRIVHAWGMTETSPVATFSWPPPGSDDSELPVYAASQGRPSPFLEVRIVGEDGSEVAWDGESTGELEIRGPWVAATYYREQPTPDKFDRGWLRTGDVAAITPDGFIRISDRAKDVIKSGGEWISSVEIENLLMDHPGVVEAAVIACPDERWGERPLACVVAAGEAEDRRPGIDELRDHLRGRLPRWWLPERFAYVEEVPKTSVGTFDKTRLRQRLGDGRLAVVVARGACAASSGPGHHNGLMPPRTQPQPAARSRR